MRCDVSAYGVVREFKNHNINFRFNPDFIFDNYQGNLNRVSAIEAFCWAIESLDCEVVGEEYCLSNWSMGCTLYNAYSDCIYILDFCELEEVALNGKTLKLYARPVDPDTRELIDREV